MPDTGFVAAKGKRSLRRTHTLVVGLHPENASSLKGTREDATPRHWYKFTCCVCITYPRARYLQTPGRKGQHVGVSKHLSQDLLTTGIRALSTEPSCGDEREIHTKLIQLNSKGSRSHRSTHGANSVSPSTPNESYTEVLADSG